MLFLSGAAQAADLALVDVHVPDLRSAALLPDRVVEIEGQRILAERTDVHPPGG